MADANQPNLRLRLTRQKAFCRGELAPMSGFYGGPNVALVDFLPSLRGFFAAVTRP